MKINVPGFQKVDFGYSKKGKAFELKSKNRRYF